MIMNDFNILEKLIICMRLSVHEYMNVLKHKLLTLEYELALIAWTLAHNCNFSVDSVKGARASLRTYLCR